MSPTSPSLSTSRIERYYGKIVTLFVLLTVALVGVIIYFSFSETQITVTPAIVSQDVQVEMSLRDVDGVLLITEAEDSLVYDEIEGDSVPGNAGGTITLVNNYRESQPLVETTRVLHESGVLFRTQETVTVPAGGSVQVEVRADEEGASGNVPAGRFEIVALWDGLKEDIYGESDSAMTGGLVTAGVVSQSDVANAQAALEEQLLENAWTRIQADVTARAEGLPPEPLLLEIDEPYLIDELAVSSTALAGDNADSFTVTKKISAGAPVVNREELERVLAERVATEMPAGYVLASSDISFDETVIEVESISEDKTDANLTVTVPVSARAEELSGLFETRSLTGMTEEEVRAFLTAFDEVEEVSVRFSPFWVTTTPDTPDNISLIVE